jgi:hypothetical protein
MEAMVRQILTINGMKMDLEWEGDLEISVGIQDSIIIECNNPVKYYLSEDKISIWE